MYSCHRPIAILTNKAEINGEITKYIRVNANNKNKFPYGGSFIFIASLTPTPNIKIGVIRGMINIGSKIFPLLVPKINAEPINPINEIARLPEEILITSQGIFFKSILSKIANIGDVNIKGINIINQYDMPLDNIIISRGIGLVAI